MPPKRRANVDEEVTTPSKRSKTSSTNANARPQAQNSPAKARRVTKPIVETITTELEQTPESPPAIAQKTSPAKARVNKSASKVESSTVPKHSKHGKAPTNGTAVPKRGNTKKVAIVDEEQTDGEEDQPKKSTKVPIKRKSKAEKEAEAMPLRPRTPNLRMFVGAHVSGAGGVHNSVTNAVHIGGNAFALFLKSQRKWENPALKEDHRDGFKNLCTQHGYAAHKHVLPHGSYLVNLAQSEKDKAEQAYNSFLDDLKRCEALGIKLYNFHPGNTGSHPRSEAISRIAQQLNKAIEATSNVVPVLETMAGGGNAIGSTFEDIRDIISGIKDKTRIGVCIDTCHIFAAGYDIRSPEAFKETIDRFDQVVGLKYLRGFHMNDSKAPLGSHRDLHQNIGQGFLGLRAFHNFMNEPRFENIPMVLETPTDRKDEKGKTIEDKSVWANEIKLLESLIGMDASSKEFLDLEKSLAANGAAERDKIQDQVNKKVGKDKKKSQGKKGKAAAEDDTEISDESD